MKGDIIKTNVLLNGNVIGYVEDPENFVREVRNARRKGMLPYELNIAYLEKINEIHINTDRGRLRKPYIIVEDGKSKLTPELIEKLKKKEIDFNYLIRDGVIEFLDAEEEENAFVALNENEINEKTTHLEIDPITVYGFTVSNSPFPQNNSVARHIMFASYMKQAESLYSVNFNYRFDSRSYLLFYPQEPLVYTQLHKYGNVEKHLYGENFVIAMSTYYGYNMSDAIVLNKASVERGLARSVFYSTYVDEERRYPGGQKDRFAIPSPTAENYLGSDAYTKLGEDGLVEPEEYVKEGDVVIGKVSPPRFLEERLSVVGGFEGKVRDASLQLKKLGEDGYVDSVAISETPGATKIVKVKIRSLRIPQNGDKFSSRHAQKGVVALLVPQEDMPFSDKGTIPDILVNPHSIPTRMTFGHLLEVLTGKAASLTGEKIDGTGFRSDGKEIINKYGEILKKYGFDETGEETFYDGITGRPFKAKVFTGVIYYLRLYHMVSNKIQVRSKGKVQLLTHQPTEGRARQGGLRFGEMERDVLIGYGASLLLKDRLLDQSDKTNIWVCKECGSIGYYDYIKKTPICPVCKSTNLEEVEVSYAFKLLLDEIKSMHINPTITLGE